MCKIHRAAFDAHIAGVTAHYEVRVQERILREEDGPTLQHALQGVQGSRLACPKRRDSWPDRDLLAERFERFRLGG